MDWGAISVELWAVGTLVIATATAGGVGAARWYLKRREARDRRRR